MSSFSPLQVICLKRSIAQALASYNNSCITVQREWRAIRRNSTAPGSQGTPPDDEKPGQSSGDHTKTSSSYQSYHRRAYERKKSHFGGGEKQNGNSNQTNFSFSTGTNHYERLKLDPSADANAIKSAYYILSKQFHPDVAGRENAQSAETFSKITESYDILSNPQTRAEYDRSLNIVPQTNMDGTWNPSFNSKGKEQDFNAIHRMRQADQLFRSKLDEAFEREKRLNPKKFRAGNFNTSSEDFNHAERLRNLDRQISSLANQIHHRSGELDHTGFYKLHLYDVMTRKREAIESIASEKSGGYTVDTLANMLPWIVTAIGGIVFYAGYSIVFRNFDLANSLDSYFSSTPIEQDEGQRRA